MFVALLRGINVGGKNKLPMASLASMFAEAGCGDVATYIQSGNVVFTAAPRCARMITDVISRRIAKDFELRIPVILRPAEELRRVASSNPFLNPRAKGLGGARVGSRAAAPAVSLDALHVAFLADAPDKRRVAALDQSRCPGDSFVVRGREIYLHLPGGVARTRLTNAYFDSTLATTSTIRNWRTVLKLVEMSAGA